MAMLVGLRDAPLERVACFLDASLLRQQSSEPAPRVALILGVDEVLAERGYGVVGSPGLFVFEREAEAEAGVVWTVLEHALQRGDAIGHAARNPSRARRFRATRKKEAPVRGAPL